MEILLDLNILGRGLGGEVSRAGIFRATDALTRAMLRRGDIALHFAAESGWASELLLLEFDRQTGGTLAPRVLRAWEQPAISDREASALIAHVVTEEAHARQPRLERAQLTLLNASAKRIGLDRTFDIVHSLRTPLPPRDRIKARARAITIHDLIPLRFPEWMYDTAGDELRAIAGSVLPEDFVVVNSRSTADDITALLGIAPERVFVTPLAADPTIFQRESSAERIADVRARHGIPPGQYLLTLCTLEPRKNLLHLLETFRQVLRQQRLSDVSLVLAGATGWKSGPLFDLLAASPDLRSRVVLPGYVPDADLAALYSDARGFIYPSHYEGFGLPVLEAMQCGTPVVTSGVSSLPEVAGDAALLVSPTDAAELADALLRLLGDDALADDLSRRGMARAAEFSWDRTADLTVAAYRAMLGGA
jgi:glycosyltransferase involved in cell wall biosynthesis